MTTTAASTTGLDPNFAAALAYLAGPFSGATILLAERKSEYVRFHAWQATKGCRKADDKRFLYVAPLSWKDGKPVIGNSLRAPGQ